MSAREQRRFLAEELQKLTDTRFNIFIDGADRDEIGKPTILIRRVRMEPFPTAPLTHRLNRYSVTVVSPNVTGPDAEDVLDDMVEEVTTAVRHIPGADFESADLVAYANSNRAYQLYVILADELKKED